MEAKQVRDLMEAYASVYAQQEEEQLDEGIDFKGAAREQERRDKIQKEKDKKNPSGKDRRLAMGKFRPGASQKERAEGGRDSMREKGTIPKKGGRDMFEHVLEHLVAEGYADTNEAALAIMANMSEEWKQSIVEQMIGGPTSTPADSGSGGAKWNRGQKLQDPRAQKIYDRMTGPNPVKLPPA